MEGLNKLDLKAVGERENRSKIYSFRATLSMHVYLAAQRKFICAVTSATRRLNGAGSGNCGGRQCWHLSEGEGEGEKGLGEGGGVRP